MPGGQPSLRMRDGDAVPDRLRSRRPRLGRKKVLHRRRPPLRRRGAQQILMTASMGMASAWVPEETVDAFSPSVSLEISYRAWHLAQVSHPWTPTGSTRALTKLE